MSFITSNASINFLLKIQVITGLESGCAIPEVCFRTANLFTQKKLGAADLNKLEDNLIEWMSLKKNEAIKQLFNWRQDLKNIDFVIEESPDSKVSKHKLGFTYKGINFLCSVPQTTKSIEAVRYKLYDRCVGMISTYHFGADNEANIIRQAVANDTIGELYIEENSGSESGIYVHANATTNITMLVAGKTIRFECAGGATHFGVVHAIYAKLTTSVTDKAEAAASTHSQMATIGRIMDDEHVPVPTPAPAEDCLLVESKGGYYPTPLAYIRIDPNAEQGIYLIKEEMTEGTICPRKDDDGWWHMTGDFKASLVKLALLKDHGDWLSLLDFCMYRTEHRQGLVFVTKGVDARDPGCMAYNIFVRNA